MPTNLLRHANVARPPAVTRRLPHAAGAVAVLTVGRARIQLSLADTDTAARIWQALPLFGTAETWGACVHFEIPVESGRDRTARMNGKLGDIYFWVEDDRILIPFGPTPISRPNEIRLPRPCNVWAAARDEVTALAAVVPGQAVALTAQPAAKGRRHG